MPHQDPEIAREYQRTYSQRHSVRKTEAAAKWNREHPERRRAIKIKARFGITAEIYDAMLVAQEGVCAICQTPCSTGRLLAVDHCHLTDRVRGLLCFNCNTGLGKLEANWDRASRYLEAGSLVE